ncbi:MAG: glucose-6-phosphate isomerase, partial [Spirochaetota bacterium]
MVRFLDFDATAAGKRLVATKAPSLGSLLDSRRVASCQLPMGGGLAFNYAATAVDGSLLSLFAEFAAEQELVAKFSLLAKGEVMNPGEKRMVLHHLARGELAGKIVREGRDFRAFYEGERQKTAQFARRVRSGELRGSSGKPFATAVQ